MKITRRLTIPYNDRLSYRVYLADESGRVVSLDTPEPLKDAEAIARAVEIVADIGAEPDEAGAGIQLGETLEDTLETVLAAHKARGEVLVYADCLAALDVSTAAVSIVKPVVIEPIEEVIR